MLLYGCYTTVSCLHFSQQTHGLAEDFTSYLLIQRLTIRLDDSPVFVVFQQFNAVISIYHLYRLEEPAKSAT